MVLCLTGLNKLLDEDFKMNIRYDDSVETYKRQLMSLIEKAKKRNGDDYSPGPKVIECYFYCSDKNIS